MSAKLGMLGKVFVRGVEPFPVDTAMDQIDIELSKEQAERLIHILQERIVEKPGTYLISIAIRFEGEFIIEHERMIIP